MNAFIPIELIERQVLEAMREAGIPPLRDTRLVIDGALHRYAVEGDKGRETAGAYVIHPDGFPGGYISSWRHGVEVRWKFDLEALDTEMYKRCKMPEFRKQAEEAQRKRDADRKKAQSVASEDARIRWEAAQTAPEDHEYLRRKNVPSYGLRCREGALLVPLRDIEGHFKTFQTIAPDGTKRYFYGAPVGGAFCAIGADVKDGPVLLCEGYATGATLHELTGHAVICAMNCHNLVTCAPALRKKYPDRKIIVMADDDAKTEGNPGVTAAQSAVKLGKLDGVLKPPFKTPEDGTDWNDFSQRYGAEAAGRVLKERLAWVCMSEVERKKILDRKKLSERVEQINASDLMKMVFPPVKWAVDGFLPMGCSILCGGPKVGKSILSLHLALSVAIGGHALGKIPVERGSVAYLALEDRPWRLQERILGSDISPDADLSKLTLVTEIPRQHEGGLEWLEWWLEAHDDARLVIIDTLQKFRKQHNGKGDRYGDDYDAIGAIKKVADAYSVPLLIVHHLKKAKDEEDWLNEISGTQGIAGAADTLLSLKRARSSNTGILHRTGRDVEEVDLAMTLDGFGWRLEGAAEEYTMPDEKRRIVEYLQKHESQTPKEIAEALGLKPNTARQKLLRMSKEGLINGYCGKYWA